MVLSESKQFLFVHIPKTAGTSIRHVLEPYAVTDLLGHSRHLEQYIRTHNRFPPHLTYADAARTVRLDLNRLFKFTFVRNPWARYVSMYEFYRQLPTHAMHQRCASCSFEEFIDDIAGGRASFDTMDQLNYILPPAGLGPLDYIGRTETIAADFPAICERIGVEPRELPVLNTTEHKDYRAYYNDALRLKVAKLCEPETWVLGYSF